MSAIDAAFNFLVALIMSSFVVNVNEFSVESIFVMCIQLLTQGGIF